MKKIAAVTLDKIFIHFRSRPLIWDTITTTILGTLGKGIGFLIPFFIAGWFGISSDTDAFFFAYGLIIFLANIFSPVVEAIIVPFIAELRAKNEEVGAFVGRVLGMSAIGLVVISIFFLALLKPLLPVITRFSPEGLDLIFVILLESSPLVVLLAWTGILAGSLNAYKAFGLTSFSPAFRAVVTLAFIFALKGRIGVHSIALGYVAGEIFRLAILLYLVRKLGLFRLKISVGYERRFMDFFKTSSFFFIGLSMMGFSPIINKTLASWLGDSSVSILEYADRLYQIPMTFISQGLFVVLLTHLSDDYYRSDRSAFRQKVNRMAAFAGTGTLFFSLLLILFRHPLVGLAYGHGKFNAEYMASIIGVFVIYVAGLAPTITGLIFARAHMVLKNTKVFMTLSLLNFIMNIVFNLALIGPMGVYGLALATTFAYVIFSIGLFLTFHNQTAISKTKI